MLKDRYGPKTRLVLVSPPRGFFARRLGFFGGRAPSQMAAEAAHGLFDAAEERALWSRFGL